MDDTKAESRLLEKATEIKGWIGFGSLLPRMKESRLLEKATEIKGWIVKYGFRAMPHLARFFLMATFLDDGTRMIFQWNLQIDYIERTWDLHVVLATIIIIINMVGQLGSCFLLLLGKKEVLACFTLYGLIVLQVIIYNLAFVPTYLIRNLALVGAVTMLLADSQPSSRELLDPQLPSLGRDHIRRTISQFMGRVLLVLMFLTLIRFEFSYARIIESVVGSVLLILIVIGYKTKEASLLLALWLYVLNFYLNSWWNVPPSRANDAETMKFDFFQTLSVTGGFLLVVSMGPGSFSVDELKKTE